MRRRRWPEPTTTKRFVRHQTPTQEMSGLPVLPPESLSPVHSARRFLPRSQR